MSSRGTETDVILVGAGVMSATLGSLLKELDPSLRITLFEKLDSAGKESSNVWNNAGTGHSALCELNYTKEQPDGSMDLNKATKINEQFQISKQFWSYLADQNLIDNPEEFIKPLPHMSMVQGEDNIAFLKKRFNAMSNHPLFQDMEFSENPETLMEWFPLIMEGRTSNEPIAATKVDNGTDVNFGALTRKLLDSLESKNVDINYSHSVEDIKQTESGAWEVKVRDTKDDVLEYHTAKFVFIGAGGGSLHLLQKSGVPEGRHIGGFPVSGQFMVCNNPAVIEEHNGKVYGKAKVGSPPMSVPHLDTRFIGNEKSLLFGPFAGFSPKFLKEGSLFDLVTSVRPNNALTMLSAGTKELSLVKYLVQQLILTKEQRMEQLREFIPNAKAEDWDLVTAGQRVQVIKDTDTGGKGTLQFGTELVTGAEGTIAALLGASPGASTAVDIMLEIINKCFPERVQEWEPKIKEMIPSYGKSLTENPELLEKINAEAARTLGLEGNKQATLV